MRIFNQMEHYPVDIIGNYGLQYAAYNPQIGAIWTFIAMRCCPVTAKAWSSGSPLCGASTALRSFGGENVVYHPSGCLTFPILGTKALQEDKLALDPDRSKRRRIYQEVVETFSDYCVFVGGSSSFDMAPKPYNKYYALELYCKEHGLSHENVVYIGDDYGMGGNDESVYLSDFPYLTIDDYTTFPQVVSDLLK